MLGTLVNTLAIVLGTVVGLLLRKKLSSKVQQTVMTGLGMCVVVMGIADGIQTQQMILVLTAVVLGGIVGALLNIENTLENVGNKIEKALLKKKDGKEENLIAKGFITATLVYCVGAMGILGAIESGTQGNHNTLFAKAMLDGTSAVFFASALGPGTGLAAIVVFFYQGGITLLAKWIAPFMSEGIIRELSAVGGILILGIGINLLEIKKVSVANLLPALLIPIAYGLVFKL